RRSSDLSFVGGALIVLTMFDEIQVTKVDGLQGSIGELQNKVQYWKDYQGRAGITVEWIEKARVQCAEALEESRDYTRYLEKESLKEPDKTFEDITAYQRQRKDVLTNALTATKTTLAGLEKLQPRLNTLDMRDPDTLIHSLIKQTIPLTLQTKVEKARKNSFDLMSHLQAKSLKSRNSKEHYNTVMRDMTRINNRIANLNLAVSLDFLDKELSVTKEETSLLTKQTPYTLLMMRVVEIGLPLILSILSIIFLLRYSLTEKRSHEIKDLLEKRSAERLREENAAGNAIT
ncbi:MAG: hypothetical protein PHD61_11550, partial [Bacteroidales bacterium]|nr:hypothetical protein [Bacteroidales bacterium]